MCYLKSPNRPPKKKKTKPEINTQKYFAIELFLVEQERSNHSNDVKSEWVGDPRQVLLNFESTVTLFNRYLQDGTTESTILVSCHFPAILNQRVNKGESLVMDLLPHHGSSVVWWSKHLINHWNTDYSTSLLLFCVDKISMNHFFSQSKRELAVIANILLWSPGNASFSLPLSNLLLKGSMVCACFHMSFYQMLIYLLHIY